MAFLHHRPPPGVLIPEGPTDILRRAETSVDLRTGDKPLRLEGWQFCRTVRDQGKRSAHDEGADLLVALSILRDHAISTIESFVVGPHGGRRASRP